MAAELLDCITLTVPDDALDHFESALSSVCRAVSFFQNEEERSWDISAVKERGAFESDLLSALMLAEMLTGCSPALTRSLVPVGGWLARTKAAFPEQRIGRRFVVRGTHIEAPPIPGKIMLTVAAWSHWNRSPDIANRKEFLISAPAPVYWPLPLQKFITEKSLLRTSMRAPPASPPPTPG
jgi:hypothetical protein